MSDYILLLLHHFNRLNTPHPLHRPSRTLLEELLLLLWGIFFIANRDEPRFKGRDLVKSAKQGAQTIVRGATSIATTSTRRNSNVAPTREEDEVVPAWITSENAESKVKIK